MLVRRALAVAAVLAAALAGASGASATTAYTDSLVGAETVPVSSTLGTFVGVAEGDLPAAWRVQIRHEPLASGPTVSITGGRFSFLTTSRRRLAGPVTGGSVQVVDRGSRCTNQLYRVSVRLSIGSFTGTLTHHRHSFLGRCVVYAATIRGDGVFRA